MTILFDKGKHHFTHQKTGLTPFGNNLSFLVPILLNQGSRKFSQNFHLLEMALEICYPIVLKSQASKYNFSAEKDNGQISSVKFPFNNAWIKLINNFCISIKEADKVAIPSSFQNEGN